jgi:ubiquinone/menaquinone biosynthesis C-methylase UbiE
MNDANTLSEEEHTSIPDAKYYVQTRNRFDRRGTAVEYAKRKNTNTRRNRREWQCIEKALRGIPSGASVLDLPCGTGRLASLLEPKGYRITEADYSQHMIDVAIEAYLEKMGLDELPEHIQFVQTDVMNTEFEDGEFDAVVCNRLLHHFPTPALRQEALSELARISKGVLVISYFTNFAVSALRFHMKNKIKGRTPTDRIPIWFSELEQDLQACSLRCVGTYPVRFGLSPQTYLRLEKI